MISVVIPAYNEERYLPETLDHLRVAIEALGAVDPRPVEVVVVDNASTDRTAEVARSAGARVVEVPERNIARVRNAGAAATSGDPLVFLDADTLVPPNLLVRIVQTMADPKCSGGSVDTEYRPARRLIRCYLALWRGLALALGMAQGVLQFCRRDRFEAIGGYDETLFLSEDVDFHWRLGRAARTSGGHLRDLRDLRVVPSCRRYDQWSTWRILAETNPLTITILQRSRTAWRGWYGDVPR